LILSNTAIIEALNERRLVIEPRPREPGLAASSDYDSTAVNLTLGENLLVPSLGLDVAVTPGRGNVAATIRQLSNLQAIDEDGYELTQNRLVLGSTSEWVELPLLADIPMEYVANGCLAARVEGKSSLARYGLIVHFTAPTIHAGFAGNITLEMINLGAAPIRLYKGMPVCQLILEQVLGDPFPAPSRFQGQTDPAGPAST
jgi:dCTP deaminase